LVFVRCCCFLMVCFSLSSSLACCAACELTFVPVQCLLNVSSVAVKKLSATHLLADDSSNCVCLLSAQLFSAGKNIRKLVLAPNEDLDTVCSFNVSCKLPLCVKQETSS
jgi:hypothetical protein